MLRRLACLLLSLSAMATFPQTAPAAEARIFMATWRGCEEACQGFHDHIAGTGRDVAFEMWDAGQDAGKLPNAIAAVRESAPDLVVSWGTSVTRAIAGDLSQRDDPGFNHDIPQVFMIVADPVGSGIVESLDRTGRANLTGTYNRMPEEVTIQTIRSYLPAFDTLGMLYNENEPNSVLKIEEMRELSETLGFGLVTRTLALGPEGLPVAEEIAPKMRELARAGADFVYVGSSSFLQANSAFMGAAARSAKLPLLSPYEQAVLDGNALISVAASYYEVGRLAGRQAEAILFEGKAAGELPVARMQEFAVTVNLSMAKDIGVYPPVGIVQIAEIVE